MLICEMQTMRVPIAYLVQHVGYLLCLHQLLRLQMLRLHLALLRGQSMDILLDILQIHVHNGDALLHIHDQCYVEVC